MQIARKARPAVTWGMRLLWDPDAEQTAVYIKAGFDPDEPCLLSELAFALGFRILMTSALAAPGDAYLDYDGTIYVRRGLPKERRRFAVAHELAEAHLAGEIDEGLEDACNALAAALIAPRRAFQRAMRTFGQDDFEQLALPFGMTHTSAALRTAEIRERHLVVVTPLRVYARGEWHLTESRLRAMSQLDLPGLRKAQLRDDPRRTVLVVELDVDAG